MVRACTRTNVSKLFQEKTKRTSDPDFGNADANDADGAACGGKSC
jgi:hypothetical protein